MPTAIKLFFLTLFNNHIRGLITKYGKQVVLQLLKAGYEWMRIKNSHPEWNEYDRHRELAKHLRSLDLIPETQIDEDTIDFLCKFFLD